MNTKEIWFINGIPGAGKSTTAKALAKRLLLSAHIEGDTVQDFIISGKVSPGEQPPKEEKRQIHLCVANQCLLATSLGAAGFTPVIDYIVVNKDRVEEYQKHLPVFDIFLVTLNPGTNKALERDVARPEKTVAHLWTHLDEEIKKGLNGLGLWVDNSTMTLDQTVTYILEHKEEAQI